MTIEKDLSKGNIAKFVYKPLDFIKINENLKDKYNLALKLTTDTKTVNRYKEEE